MDSDDNDLYADHVESFDESYSSSSDKNYKILKEVDIQRRQEDDIVRISTVLSVSRAAACMLLHHYKWNLDKVDEAWFSDEERVRKAVGLVAKPIVELTNFKRKLTCGICFDTYFPDHRIKTACGHSYCNTCWAIYISTSISDGPGCLSLRCPDPPCGAAIGEDMVNLLASDEDKKKYRRYLIRSYIEGNKKTKWCPAPDCDSAIEYDGGSGSYNVSCVCSCTFCWNCVEDAHRPVDCDTVAKWILKNNSESENVNWILVNTKPCPNCKRSIEKNHGCMHMTCSAPCKFEFCWLCLGSWGGHNSRNGGSSCNGYGSVSKINEESEQIREMAKKSLQRYTHYFERWAANQSSWKKALADLHQMQTVHFEKLVYKYVLSELQLQFVIEAWLQIVECRRVLKWTYAYGYYLPEKESARIKLFEYLQGEAEAGLERLHLCAEKELTMYLKEDVTHTTDEFNNFRTKLIDLTVVTRNYFANLVRALENGLSEACTKTTKSQKVAGSSKSRVAIARKRKHK